MIKADTLKKRSEKRQKYLIRKTYWTLRLRAEIEIRKTSFDGRVYYDLAIDWNYELSFFILKKKLEAKGFKCEFKDWVTPFLRVSW